MAPSLRVDRRMPSLHKHFTQRITTAAGNHATFRGALFGDPGSPSGVSGNCGGQRAPHRLDLRAASPRAGDVQINLIETTRERVTSPKVRSPVVLPVARSRRPAIPDSSTRPNALRRRRPASPRHTLADAWKYSGPAHHQA